MSLIKVNLPPDIDKKFREKALKKYGYKRGTLTAALLDAINLWLSQSDISDEGSTYINYNEIRSKFPGKYVVLNESKVILVKDTLQEIYNELPNPKDEKYTLLAPHILNKERNLGWRMKRVV